MIYSVKMIAIVRKNLCCLKLKHTSTPVLASRFFSTSLKSTSPRIFDKLLNKYDFPPELASRVACKLTKFEKSEKVDSTFSFFEENGFSNAQLAKILKFKPRFLVANVEGTLKPKIKIFQDLGLSSDDICKLISSNPTLLHLSVNDNIIPSLSALKGLMGSNSEVARVIRNSSRLLSTNLKSSVLANVEFLKSCGISMDRIRIMLANNPNPFMLKPEVTRKSVEKVKEMGVDATSKSFIYAISTIASIGNEAWELRLQDYRDMGFSDADVLSMFKKSPRMFLGSMEKKRNIKELLLSTGKFDMSSIVNYPLSLAFSIEKRYKPRLQILETLETRELIKGWPELGTLCSASDDKFFTKFVRPYLYEVGDVYIPKTSARGKK